MTKMRWLAVWFMVVGATAAPAAAQDAAAAKKKADAPAKVAPSDPLVDVRRGTIPIIITAPHGGTEPVPGVGVRTKRPVNPPKGTPKWVIGTDINTRELARRIVAELESRLGGKPYYVMARFQRRYIDANRAAEHSYETPAAKFYHDAYHETLAEYVAEVQKKFGAGLVIDVHGQASFKDEILVGTVGGQTVKLLIDRHGRGALVGKEGLVGRLNAAGILCDPEIDAENLNVAAGLNGGYTVQMYGSHQPTAIDAVQFEYGSNLRKIDRLDDTARRTAKAVAEFYHDFVERKKVEGAAQ